MLFQERSDLLLFRRAAIPIHHWAKFLKKLIRAAGGEYGYKLPRLIGDVYEGMGRARGDIHKVTAFADGSLVT